jgi:hypothetical protein
MALIEKEYEVAAAGVAYIRRQDEPSLMGELLGAIGSAAARRGRWVSMRALYSELGRRARDHAKGRRVDSAVFCCGLMAGWLAPFLHKAIVMRYIEAGDAGMGAPRG